LAPDVWPVVELGVGDIRGGTQQAKWDVSKWDTAGSLWAGSEPTWLDITCDVISVASHVGRERSISRFDPGTCTIVAANSTGWADILQTPANPALLSIRPGRQIRWGVQRGTSPPVWKWRGFIDAHAANYDGQTADTDTVTLTCIDALGEVGRVALSKVDPPVGAGEAANVRITRILDAAGWRTEWRDIQPSSVAMLATDLDGRAVDQLSQVADTVGGSVFGDIQNRVAFRNRDWQTWLPSRPYDATIGNVAPTDVCPNVFDLRFDRSETTTRAVVNYEGAAGGPVVVDDTNAQLLYGVETSPEMTDLQSSDTAQLTTIANRIIRTQGIGTQPRVQAVTFDAARGDPTVTAMIGADPFVPTLWRVRIVRDGRTLADRVMFVTSVDHELDAKTWTLRVGLDDAAPWQAQGGRWDGAYWDRALWASVAQLRDEAVRLLDRLEVA